MRKTMKAVFRKSIAIFLLAAMTAALFSFAAFGIEAPTGLSATATGTSSISLSWSPVDGATEYRVSRSTAGGAYAQIGTTVSTIFNDSGLASGTEYSYTVAAVDASSQSVDSASESATTHVTVTFDLMGGAMESPATSVVAHGGRVSSPSYPYRTKHRFAGWCTDAAGRVPFSFSSAVTSNMTLYASWTPEYTVTYYRNQDAADGVSVLGDFYLLYDRVDLSTITSVGHTKTNWYRAGYSFSGWSYTRNGELLTSPIYVIGSDITLYAQYRKNTYTAAFDLDGGMGEAEPQSLGYEEKIKKPADPSKEGYTFTGWFYREQLWNFSADTMPDGDITLTAVWLEQKYPVTFDFADGRPMIQQLVLSDSLIDRPEDPKRDGYLFAGWLYDGEMWDFGTRKMPAENITLTASWVKDKNAAAGDNPADTDDRPGGSGSDDPTPRQAGNLFSDLLQGNIPLGGLGESGYFSVISLFMTMVSAVITAIVLVRSFSKKKTNGFRRHMTALIGLFAVILGVLTIASFFLQQDFSAPKMLFTGTTPITGLLFLVHLCFAVIYFRKGSRKGEWADYSKDIPGAIRMKYK